MKETFLFKIGLSRFINKFSLISDLSLLQSLAKILKSSKFMGQLHCNKGSGNGDCLNVFEAFSCKIGKPHVLSSSGVKVAEGFPIISNLQLLHVS